MEGQKSPKITFSELQDVWKHCKKEAHPESISQNTVPELHQASLELALCFVVR